MNKEQDGKPTTKEEDDELDKVLASVKNLDTGESFRIDEVGAHMEIHTIKCLDTGEVWHLGDTKFAVENYYASKFNTFSQSAIDAQLDTFGNSGDGSIPSVKSESRSDQQSITPDCSLFSFIKPSRSPSRSMARNSSTGDGNSEVDDPDGLKRNGNYWNFLLSNLADTFGFGEVGKSCV
jgi:hypothetical protein